ncbi:hypothetical protein SG34_012360 [Thalassomonas viridans]|uniref:PilZ domain-containing protein n=1 Tax=Thalassomonas viridans TaxID=137584 RepID=A0AAF0CC30_9GAMM|nr:hypothetical protein [Thalassomonas viridans]WDE07605.1 hypothetical protein SG34_012360 [Thalassomonas viridans]
MFEFTPNIISLMIALTIVIFYGLSSFNFPHYRLEQDNQQFYAIETLIDMEKFSPKVLSGNRRYQLYNLVYILMLILVYSLLRALWDPLALSLLNLPQSHPVVKNILVALIVSTLLPSLPPVKALLELTRRFLHSRARIPGYARDLFALLNDNPIKLPLLYSVASPAEKAMFKESFFNNSQMGMVLNFPRIWLRYQYLYREINKEKWQLLFSRDKSFSAFPLSKIQTQHKEITRELENLQQHDINDFSDIKVRVVKQLKHIYALITCGLLHRQLNPKQSRALIEELGFEIIKENHPRFDQMNQLVNHTLHLLMVLMGACLGFFALKTLLPGQFQPAIFYQLTPVSAIGYWFLSGIFTLGTALFTAYYARHLLKHRKLWRVIDLSSYYKKSVDRPWKLYSGIGLLAYLSITGALFVADYLSKLNGFTSAYTPLEYLLWPIIPLLITLFVCYRFDTLPPDHNKQLCKQHLTKASIRQGLMLSAATFFIMAVIQLALPGETYNVADFILLSTTNGLLGFFNSHTMGYCEVDRRTTPRYFSDTDMVELQLDPKHNGPGCRLKDVSATGIKIQFQQPVSSLSNNQNINLCYRQEDTQLFFHGKVLQATPSYARIKLELTESWSQVWQLLKKIYTR